MKTIRILNKPQTRNYNIYTVIAVVLGIFIFFGLDVYINKHWAYLLVTIMSSSSIYSAIKKASKEFEKIVISPSEFKFYFLNNMKDPLTVVKENIAIFVDGQIAKFVNVQTNEAIGQADRKNLEHDTDWDILISFTINPSGANLPK